MPWCVLHRALVREYVGSAGSPGLHPVALDRLVEPWLDGLGQAAFCRQIAQADQRHTDEIQGGTPESASPRSSAGARTTPGSPWRKDESSPLFTPDGRWEPIVGAGHLVQEDAPAELTAVLIAFLQHPL